MTHYSLSQLNGMIGKVLEKHLDQTYWVIAEIGEIRLHPKGHCYLELVEKEKETIKARSKGTIWSYTYENLRPWFVRHTGSELKVGMKILVNAEVQFHEVFGLGLNIKDIDAQYTLGEKQKLKQQVILRLTEEGLMDKNKILALPLVPQRIAVISAEHAAGYQDFVSQLQGSSFQFSTKIFPADMQGQEATRSIVAALKNIFQEIEHYDLVAIIRGGGSQSDLDCYDTYLMGKAIARFPIPVLTGIGHERDETVADRVARVRLKTPTAVAEFLISGVRDFESNIDNSYQRILSHAYYQINAASQKLKEHAETIKYGSKQQLGEASREIQYLQLELLAHARHQEQMGQTHIRELAHRTAYSAKRQIEDSERVLEGLERYFRISDPQLTLQRGFSYTTLSGKPLHKVDTLNREDILETITANYKIKSTVKEVK